MPSQPLFISTPGDMLRKARHDFEVLKKELNAYNLFNFIVTVYHIRDYVKTMGTIPKNVIDQLNKDDDFALARFICNRGKHLVLKQKHRIEVNEAYVGAVSGRAISGLARSGLREWYVLFVNGKELDPIELGDRLLTMWDKFFKKYCIKQ